MDKLIIRIPLTILAIGVWIMLFINLIDPIIRISITAGLLMLFVFIWLASFETKKEHEQKLQTIFSKAGFTKQETFTPEQSTIIERSSLKEQKGNFLRYLSIRNLWFLFYKAKTKDIYFNAQTNQLFFHHKYYVQNPIFQYENRIRKREFATLITFQETQNPWVFIQTKDPLQPSIKTENSLSVNFQNEFSKTFTVQGSNEQAIRTYLHEQRQQAILELSKKIIKIAEQQMAIEVFSNAIIVHVPPAWKTEDTDQTLQELFEVTRQLV
ncbi:MAG: hypothetical protein ACMXYF_03380 [Candidatus Woesearchaeota archaeon]